MLLVLRGYYTNQEREYLYGNAMALQPLIEQILQSKIPEASLQDQIKGLGFLSQTQIRVLDTNGTVLADSGVPESNHVVAVSGRAPVAGNVMFSVPADPPKEQVQGPLFIYRSDSSTPSPQVIPLVGQFPGGKSGDIVVQISASPYGYGFVARTESDPAHRSSQSVSVPLASNEKKLGTLEFSQGPSYGADVVHSVTNAWLLASIFAIAIAALTGWFMSQRVTRPVLALEHATRAMEQGDLSVRVDLQNEKQQEFLSLANSFNGMVEQVAKTISTLREFVADAAHELHTPLTALQANIELAQDEHNASERIRYLTRAQEQGQRLEALVESLLKLSRIEAADSKSSVEPVNFIQLAREVGEQFASRAEQAERTFTMSLPGDETQVNGNESQLRQVILNLLENSLKFTPAQGTISLALESQVDKVQLNISDSGIGIPPEDLPHLFERFHRGRNASEYPGNGLGLAIVKAILANHHGNIVVQSKPAQGTTVTLTLPRVS
jgi:signal transduction histidine kinase